MNKGGELLQMEVKLQEANLKNPTVRGVSQ